MIKQKDLIRFLPKYLEGNKAFTDYVEEAVHYYEIGTQVSNVPLEKTPHITLREPGFPVVHFAILLGHDLKHFLVYKYNLSANTLIDMPTLVPVRDVFSQEKLLTLKLIRKTPKDGGKSVAVEQHKKAPTTTTSTTKKVAKHKAKATSTTKKPTRRTRAKSTTTKKVSK